ncbi:MAG: NF038122 family metalloprotease [Pseudomonadota bacterium]|nr:NF038122 family metalloprotease [Pseudomonadota bacterium]
MKNIKKSLKIATLLVCAYASSAQALVIHFNYATGMDPTALAGFQAAATRWTDILRDNVQVNLNIGFTALGAGILGSTGSTKVTYSYDAYRNALAADAIGVYDQAAVAGLSKSSCLNVVMNGTGVNPAGVGSGALFLDNNCNANNNTIRPTLANARALGLTAAVDSRVDGSISFSNLFTWDFNAADGVDANAYDFVGVATHEIGHALGFISGVDILDGNRAGNYSDAAFTYIAPTDLYRCSDVSKGAGADLDFSADTRTKYFSLDKCNTTLATFSTGVAFGDGRQASHWKDNAGYGIMDPTAGKGEVMTISALDRKMFDVIGWNVPEPGSIALFGLGLAALFGMRKRNA